MCDYSLETYRSRPAREGERYTLHRFPSGTKGFVSPGDCNTAVCLAPDTRLRLSEIHYNDGVLIRDRGLDGLGPVENATFIRRDRNAHRDAVRFDNGVEISLQWLPSGTRATVLDALDDDIEWRKLAAEFTL